jgi:lysophospholipase L1-like esterase
MPYAPPACENGASTPGRVTTPSPLVSLDARVTASDNVTYPEHATDGVYHDPSGVVFGLPTEDEPAWVAIELEGDYERLLLTFADAEWGNYNAKKFTPRSYRIETSADSRDGADGEFTTVVEIEDNPVRTREHAFGFAGQRWVRFVVTAAHADSPAVRVDEFALYDIGAAGDGKPEDTWFFLGDSITAGAFTRTFNTNDFDRVISAAAPGFTPAYLNGGISGETASEGLARLERVLTEIPDVSHVLIGYGTNDSWGSQSVESVGFENSMNALVDRVLEADKVPILARIPYASTAHATLPDFNAVIDRITADRGLPCGADLYGHFLLHPDELAADGVHPATAGYSSMNRVWAEAVLPLYPIE